MSLNEKTTLDYQDLPKVLPHRYPMLLVDRIEDIIPGESATGYKYVTHNEPFFEGHFPGEPIMPGVLIIEAMAQTSGAIVLQTYPNGAEGKSIFFTSIENAKFRQAVRPGNLLQMKVEKIRHKLNIWKFDAKAYVNDELCTEATFMAMIIEHDK